MSTDTNKQHTLTDKDKLVGLLTEFGIGFVDSPEGDNAICCRVGAEKVALRGYVSTETAFRFDDRGKFIEMVLVDE
jgi:hypothetical protein